MKLPFTTLDVFTTTPFSGNSLAVVRVPASHRNTLTEEKKQKIATEFNLSEITFLHESSENDDGTVADYDIFTARSRMTFAGHPTIGTAIFVSTTGAPLFPHTHSLRTLAGTIPLDYNASTRTASWLDAGSGWDGGFTGSFFYVDLGLDPEADQRRRRLLRTRSIGTREDPGTGSASAALCCYLALKEAREEGGGDGEEVRYFCQGGEDGGWGGGE
ncbi:putative phenazine biosynthesis-like protein [Lasiodiplodia theobromae]|nr:putative phenazine biosynthesis-like protein [Lasiodiplodia theobromae]